MSNSIVRKFGVGVASLALVASAAAPAFAAAGDPVDNRLAGADRYETAIAIAKDTTEFSSPSVAYVASGKELVDAVTAGTLKDGPLLLVNDDAAVVSKVATAIKDLGVSKVIVIGGEKAVSKDTVSKIVPTGVVSERISGADRFETAAKIAEKSIVNDKQPTTVYLANGKTLVDAMVGGQLIDGPILLTDGSGKLPTATEVALNKKLYNANIIALGGAKAVTDAELNAANVARVIIPDSFIKDYQSEIVASAKADIMANGFLTAAPKVTAEKIAKAAGVTDKIQLAKITATFPKVDLAVAKKATTGALFLQIKDDGTVDSGNYVDGTTANTFPKNKLDDGTTVVNFAGTSQALTKALEAQTAAEGFSGTTAYPAAVSTTTTGIFAGDTPSSTLDTNTTDTSAARGALVFTELEKVFALGAGANLTVNEYFKKISVPVPANKTNYTTANDEHTKALAALKTAVAVKIVEIKAAVPVAAKANKDALKAQADAQKALDDRAKSRVPSSALNRVAGADRYATSVAIAKKVFGDKGVGDKTATRLYFANGDSFADAAVSGMLTRGPVLLVMKDSIPSTVNDYAKTVAANVVLARTNIVALGGKGVIADKNLTSELDTLAPISATDKEYRVSFTQPVVAYANGSFAYTGKEATYVSESKAEKVPNGGTIKVIGEYNIGDGWKTAAGKADGKVTASFDVATSKVTIATTGATGATGSEIKDAKVRVTVKVVNANGDEIAAARTSEIKTLKYSVK